MSRSLRRGALAATAIAFSLATLSACGAGNDAQTLGVRPDNAATTVGTVKIQNVAVVTQPELDDEGPASVVATLFNDGTKDETVESITLPGSGAPVKLSPAEGRSDVTVPAGGSVIIGGEGHASAVVENGREAVEDGTVQEVVFGLSETGDVGLQALVVTSSGYYKGVGPSAGPAESAEPSESASPEASESAEASASESASESADPSASASEQAEESPEAGESAQ
ncbi:DUF461 domain-containing protein [Streptomyces sp. NPDC060194]|uniref:DUF461 domain-containing protein n=1 Tax=Streptomyces sp. NPDC060194 TaxID=3347069 RepID=UPI003663F15B